MAKYTHDLTRQQYIIMKKLLDGHKPQRYGKTTWLIGGETFPSSGFMPLFNKNALKRDWDEEGKDKYEVTDYGRELVARFERGESPYSPKK